MVGAGEKREKVVGEWWSERTEDAVGRLTAAGYMTV